MTIPMPDPMVEVDKQIVSSELQYTYLAPSGGLEHGTYLITTTQAEAYADARVREVQQWRPIETAPRDGTPILLGGKRGRVAIGFVNEDFRWAWPYVFAEPIAWMPLPPPPEGER